MLKRSSWPIKAVLFSGAMAFCLAPAIAQHHDDKDEKTEHVEKSHHKDHKGVAHGGHHEKHGHDAHGGHAGPGGGHDAPGGHGGAAPGGHGGAAPGGHGDHHGDHHGGVLGGVVGALTGGHDAHGGHHAGPERAHGHHFTYQGKRHEAFRGPAYHWPHGHGYHRPHVGWAMPLLFLSVRYILDDYGYYGLEPPPPGTVWVRYGADILLVDRHNGHVIRVIYGAFVP